MRLWGIYGHQAQRPCVGACGSMPPYDRSFEGTLPRALTCFRGGQRTRMDASTRIQEVGLATEESRTAR